MPRPIHAALVLPGALLIGLICGAGSPLPRAFADAGPASGAARRASQAQQPVDPNKKMPGEACKSSDECQRHHSCEKVGDKSVCKAPPPPKLPPGAVT